MCIFDAIKLLRRPFYTVRVHKTGGTVGSVENLLHCLVSERGFLSPALSNRRLPPGLLHSELPDQGEGSSVSIGRLVTVTLSIPHDHTGHQK